MTFKCEICLKTIRSNSKCIQCAICTCWCHLKCSPLSIKDYNHLQKINDCWICLSCRSDIFPFKDLSREELIELSYNSNTSCLCSSRISKLKLSLLPCFDVMASINNNPNLLKSDIDQNLPTLTNFDYYSPHDFHSSIPLSCNAKSFSIFHLNIRSLSANFDSFNQLLCDLGYLFSIIGITETKIKVDSCSTFNADLPGYSFISQPSISNAGGVGLFVKNNLLFFKREDLCRTEPEFESLFIEINIPRQHNIVCGAFYRHPNCKLDKTFDFLFKTAELISKEQKFCALMGDFNINLLNFESHNVTDNFINTLGSFSFNPQILKPTRITDHSATLIDNIFYNSLEHQLISGNILCNISDHLPNFYSGFPKETPEV